MDGLTQGRIVQYTLSLQDAAAINRRRTDGHSIAERMGQTPPAWPEGAQAHIGNTVNAGDVFPAIVVRVWPHCRINGQVFLDGTDTFWALSAEFADHSVPGHWHWTPRD